MSTQVEGQRVSSKERNNNDIEFILIIIIIIIALSLFNTQHVKSVFTQSKKYQTKYLDTLFS